MARGLTVLLACSVAVLSGAAGGRAADGAPRWRDVPTSHWARVAVDYVAREHAWMRDYGAASFKPDAPVTRAGLATAVVRAFAPTAVPDGSVTFGDLSAEERRTATRRLRWPGAGWRALEQGSTRRGRPRWPECTRRWCARSGSVSAARALDRLSSVDGYAFAHPLASACSTSGWRSGSHQPPRRRARRDARDAAVARGARVVASTARRPCRPHGWPPRRRSRRSGCPRCRPASGRS